MQLQYADQRSTGFSLRYYLVYHHAVCINLLFEVFVVVYVGDDEIQVIFDVETVFDAAHGRRQRIVGQVHTYRYADTCIGH